MADERVTAFRYREEIMRARVRVWPPF